MHSQIITAVQINALLAQISRVALSAKALFMWILQLNFAHLARKTVATALVVLQIALLVRRASNFTKMDVTKSANCHPIARVCLVRDVTRQQEFASLARLTPTALNSEATILAVLGCAGIAKRAMTAH